MGSEHTLSFFWSNSLRVNPMTPLEAGEAAEDAKGQLIPLALLKLGQNTLAGGNSCCS
jgi:hypothetical protein